jgi:hypothetical protein
MDDIRKRVNIARRKAESSTSAHQLPDTASPSKKQKTTSDHGLSESQALSENVDDEREDIEVIVDFFASGRGNDSDDDLVWQNLANYVSFLCFLVVRWLIFIWQRVCKTNGDWPTFYQQREQLINDGIRMKIETQASP